jgi:hypothetical protein
MIAEKSHSLWTAVFALLCSVRLVVVLPPTLAALGDSTRQ